MGLKGCQDLEPGLTDEEGGELKCSSGSPGCFGLAMRPKGPTRPPLPEDDPLGSRFTLGSGAFGVLCISLQLSDNGGPSQLGL